MTAAVVAVGIVGVVAYLALVHLTGRYVGHVAGKHKARARDDRWDA